MRRSHSVWPCVGTLRDQGQQSTYHARPFPPPRSLVTPTEARLAAAHTVRISTQLKRQRRRSIPRECVLRVALRLPSLTATLAPRASRLTGRTLTMARAKTDEKGHTRAGRAPKPAPAADSHAVAGRAYELYLSRGGEHGHDIDDWLQAERELRGPSEAAAE
jgi:Protein of unknown function (DUF2934)